MLSLLELRVSVEPCGDETGVSPPEPRAASKVSFVNGTAASEEKSVLVPKHFESLSIELLLASSVLLEQAARCSLARARSWKRPESFSKRSVRRRTRPDLCNCIRVSCCCDEQTDSKPFTSFSFPERFASVSLCLTSPSCGVPLSWSRDLLSGLSAFFEGIALASRHTSEESLSHLAVTELAQGGV